MQRLLLQRLLRHTKWGATKFLPQEDIKVIYEWLLCLVRKYRAPQTSNQKMKQRPNTQNIFCQLTETQCDPMLANSFQPAAGPTTSATGFSGTSRCSATSGGIWSQWWKELPATPFLQGNYWKLSESSSFLPKEKRRTQKHWVDRCWVLRNMGEAYHPFWRDPHHSQTTLCSSSGGSQQPTLAPRPCTRHCSLPEGLPPMLPLLCLASALCLLIFYILWFI